MTAINGHSPQPITELPEPAPAIARAIYEAGAEEGDVPWDGLAEEEREALTNYARDHIGAHMHLLAERGFRILPPGAVLRPKTDDEAAAMAEGVRLYHEAKKRKPGLVGSVAPKLILPRDVH